MNFTLNWNSHILEFPIYSENICVYILLIYWILAIFHANFDPPKDIYMTIYSDNMVSIFPVSESNQVKLIQLMWLDP